MKSFKDHQENLVNKLSNFNKGKQETLYQSIYDMCLNMCYEMIRFEFENNDVIKNIEKKLSVVSSKDIKLG